MASVKAVKPGESYGSPRLGLVVIITAGAILLAAWFNSHQTTQSIRDDIPSEAVLLVLNQDKEEVEQEYALRSTLSEHPDDAVAATTLAEYYLQRARREFDPRYLGFAQGVLAHWENDSTAPLSIKRTRAILLQAQHRFAEALTLLDDVIAQDAYGTMALLTRATVRRVTGDYRGALRDCTRLASQTPIVAAGCSASILAITGRTSASLRLLTQIEAHLERQPEAVQQWLLGIHANALAQAGQYARADDYFRRALNSPTPSAYLLRAYSNHLLHTARPALAWNLLADKTHDDNLLLNAAIAAKRSNKRRDVDRLSSLIQMRLQNARRKKSSDHHYLAARYTLEFGGDKRDALVSAKKNWASSKEPWDTELLAQAAIAVKDPQTLSMLQDWMVERNTRLPRVEKLLATYRENAK